MATAKVSKLIEIKIMTENTIVIAFFFVSNIPFPPRIYFFYCHISVSGRPFVKTCLIRQRYGFGYSLEALLSFGLESFVMTKLQCSGV